MAEDLGAAARTSGGILSWAGAEGSCVWFAFGEEHSALCSLPCEDELLGAMRTREAHGEGAGNRAGGRARGGLGCDGGPRWSWRGLHQQTHCGRRGSRSPRGPAFWSEHCRIEDAPSPSGERARGAEVKAAAGPGHTELETLRWAELCPLPKVSGEALTCKVQNASALGGKVFKEVISSNEALGGGPSPA